MSDSGKKSLYLTGRLLVAMPALGDPRFQKSVIFMCAHDEGGAMGLVVNHAVPGLDLSQILAQMKIDFESSARKKSGKLPVMSGGPVETARGFILHTSEFSHSDTVHVNETFGVTGTIDVLRAIASGQGPEKMLFMLGYAGWGAGQLDRELQDNAWLVAEADPELLFATGPQEKWDLAVRKLGINPAMLSGDAGHA